MISSESRERRLAAFTKVTQAVSGSAAVGLLATAAFPEATLLGAAAAAAGLVAGAIIAFKSSAAEPVDHSSTANPANEQKALHG